MITMPTSEIVRLHTLQVASPLIGSQLTEAPLQVGLNPFSCHPKTATRAVWRRNFTYPPSAVLGTGQWMQSQGSGSVNLEELFFVAWAGIWLVQSSRGLYVARCNQLKSTTAVMACPYMGRTAVPVHIQGGARKWPGRRKPGPVTILNVIMCNYS